MGRNLVTGGMGFLGTWLARELLNNGEEVVIFDMKRELPDSAADLKGKVEIYNGDISNWVHVVEAVKKYNIDCIYHLASMITIASRDDPPAAFRVNIVGTMNVLEAARILGVRDVIFASSGATYGSVINPPPKMVYNDTLQRPDTMYSTTKLCCERLGEQYHRQYGVNFRALRFSMAVGPGRPITYFFGDWSAVITRPAQGKPYTTHSNPLIHCGYIYAKDAIQALIGLKNAPESKLRQRVYNVDGFMANLTEVVEVVKKHIPDAQITFDWDKSEEMKAFNNANSFKFDNTVAFEDFGYQPRYLLNEMVEDFINEVRKGNTS